MNEISGVKRMGDSVTAQEALKDHLQGMIHRKDPALARYFGKHRDRLLFMGAESDEAFRENSNCLGTGDCGEARINTDRVETPEDLNRMILTCYHELEHCLDGDSEYHFQSELRARRWTYNIAHRLGGIYPKLLDEMTVAAGEDFQEFGRLFNEHYPNHVGEKIRD